MARTHLPPDITEVEARPMIVIPTIPMFSSFIGKDGECKFRFVAPMQFLVEKVVIRLDSLTKLAGTMEMKVGSRIHETLPIKSGINLFDEVMEIFLCETIECEIRCTQVVDFSISIGAQIRVS